MSTVPENLHPAYNENPLKAMKAVHAVKRGCTEASA